ncbi:MAG: sugar transferase [Candidatus Omnitrophica bacterium]|nr:sugar transferase [Candidatus Omnitrophota bacterium]
MIELRYIQSKRIFDISLALFGLFFFALPAAIIAMLIYRIDGRPVFYIKKSLGKNGKIINLFKFRSLKNNSNKITKTGKILRKTAMDELPQLINILKGDMSFVGPRPFEVCHYGFSEKGDLEKQPCDKKFAARLEVTPGLTGMAQVYLPKLADKDEIVEKDLEYIQKRSFLFDLFLILISVWITFCRRWSQESREK